MKYSGVSSGVSLRYFYCGKTAVISEQAVTVINHNNYRYRATRYREKTHLRLPCKTLPRNSSSPVTVKNNISVKFGVKYRVRSGDSIVF